MKNLLGMGLLSLGILVVAGCATTSSNCQPTDSIYMKNYQQALDNGNSESTASRMAKYSCQAHNLGKWAEGSKDSGNTPKE
ncbi:hypothetical protein I6E84_13550 [Psychrobacter sp. SCQQ22]|uniref:Lipoprotein n=1 Tax=Psychrobacter fozii TaxID=198480 RepID=A0A2V4UTI1_9GAMM|nr:MULTISPECIES: hypothetical protein [Psychrobacter]MBH0087241.1 hypothetical protein [Psychrobacter sp. SCQQ22]PYE36701.1 hypothetical protein DFP82_11150 [Psychrobacter fozii]